METSSDLQGAAPSSLTWSSVSRKEETDAGTEWMMPGVEQTPPAALAQLSAALSVISIDAARAVER